MSPAACRVAAMPRLSLVKGGRMPAFPTRHAPHAPRYARVTPFITRSVTVRALSSWDLIAGPAAFFELAHGRVLVGLAVLVFRLQPLDQRSVGSPGVTPRLIAPPRISRCCRRSRAPARRTRRTLQIVDHLRIEVVDRSQHHRLDDRWPACRR